MRADEQKKRDLLLQIARANVSKGRKRSFRSILIALAILAGLLALIVWLSWPAPPPPALTVIAFDALGLPDEEISLRAVVRAQKPEEAPESLAGFVLHFADSLQEGANGKDTKLHQNTASNAAGEATLAWRFSMPRESQLLVIRYAGDKSRPSSYDTARVFTWPAQTPLLVVEARHGLLDISEERFRKANHFSLAPLPGAAAALQQAAGRKYRVVYLAAVPQRPEDYRKLRTWLQRPGPGGRSLFPEGPALGREHYAEDDAASTTQAALLRAIKKRFRGPIIGAVRRPEDARVFQKAQVTTILVNDQAEAPEGVTRIASWDKLIDQLP